MLPMLKSTCVVDTTLRDVIVRLPSSLKKRKRGRRGGVRARLNKQKCRVSLPTVIFGNVRSLTKQYSELLTCVKYLKEY